MSAPAKSAQRPHGPFFYQTRTAPQPTVLVVEDHDDTREMLHMLLEMWGCRVVEACNGLEAVEAALRERPQFILMDSRLPFVDGLEATRHIRKNGLRDQVKILIEESFLSLSRMTGFSSTVSVTPSLVIVGLPYFLSSTTLRPFGPSVIFTVSASLFTPRKIAARDCSPRVIFFAIIFVSSPDRWLRKAALLSLKLLLESSAAAEREGFSTGRSYQGA